MAVDLGAWASHFAQQRADKKAEKKANDRKLYEAQQDRNVSGGNPIDMGSMK